MRHLLIYNPTSRSGRSEKDFLKVEDEFRKRGLEFRSVKTERKDHAIDLAFDGAASGEHDVIVPIGGDGTICEAITGMMRYCENGDNPVKLGVVHIGTSPDFNRYHHIPTGVVQQVDVIDKGLSRLVDIGKASYTGLDGNEEVSYFGSSVNLGLGSDIASRSNSRYRKYLGDTMGTLLSTLVSLANYRRSDVNAVIDDETYSIRDMINLTVGKDPHIASGMKVPIVMKEDNGEMYCLTVSSSSKLSLILNLWRLYKGDIRDYKGAGLRYCRKIEVRSNRNNKVEFDGDHRGFLPVKVEIIQKALEVICGG